MKKKILLFALLASIAGFTSCKSKKKVTEQQTIEVEEVVIENVETVKTNEGVKLTFSADLLFPTDSYTLNDKEKKELDQLAKKLNNKLKNKIRIDGYTDNTGPTEYNNTLSLKRANSVKQYLEKVGVESNRITTKGYGSSNPVADNKTADGRQKNRRVEIIILN
nr:OmpA family protein [uncultured Flavobacterium sp.]